MALFEGLEVSCLVQQGGRLASIRQRPPPVPGPIGDGGEMNAKRNVGVITEEVYGVRRPGTGRHQRRGAQHALLQRANHRIIDGMTHAEIIGVDNQQPRIVGVSQQAVCLRSIHFNFMEPHNILRATQNFFHLLALCQLIHQLIQISDLLRQWILDFLHTIATDYPGDEVGMRI